MHILPVLCLCTTAVSVVVPTSDASLVPTELADSTSQTIHVNATTPKAWPSIPWVQAIDELRGGYLKIKSYGFPGGGPDKPDLLADIVKVALQTGWKRRKSDEVITSPLRAETQFVDLTFKPDLGSPPTVKEVYWGMVQLGRIVESREPLELGGELRARGGKEKGTFLVDFKDVKGVNSTESTAVGAATTMGGFWTRPAASATPSVMVGTVETS